MSDASRSFPPSDSSRREVPTLAERLGLRIRLPLWLRIILVIPAIVAPLGILLFIARAELAHDASRCPYDEVEVRQVGPGIRVREDMRRCLEGVEERRFTVLRDGEARPLGVRRFAPEAFEGDGYGWEAQQEESGRVRVTVTNPGHRPRDFLEAPLAP